MSHSRDLNDHMYQNWIKAVLALKYGRDILSQFLMNSIEKFISETLRENRVKLCSNCSQCNIIPCGTNSFCYYDNKSNCKKHNASAIITTHRPCPDGVCDKLYLAVKQQYASGGKGPNWNQTDPTRWCLNFSEIAKCFMPVGYADKHDISDYDFSGIMSLIINAKFIQTDLHEPYNLLFFQKVSLISLYLSKLNLLSHFSVKQV